MYNNYTHIIYNMKIFYISNLLKKAKANSYLIEKSYLNNELKSFCICEHSIT